MVSGSKVRAGTAGSVGAAPRYYRDESSQEQVSLPPINGSNNSGEPQEQFYQDGSGSLAGSSADMPLDMPLSFGEQLVLETYLRCKRRPYDRRRQDELSQPRRRVPTGDAWGIKGCSGIELSGEIEDGTSLPKSSMSKIGKSQMDDLCSRLAQPKKSQVNSAVGESLALQSKELQPSKLSPADIDAISTRLALPRARANDEKAGERVAMHHSGEVVGRPVDLDRLALMARPQKRGASCRSWGVQMEDVRAATSRETEPQEWWEREHSSPGSGSKSARATKREERRLKAAAALSRSQEEQAICSSKPQDNPAAAGEKDAHVDDELGAGDKQAEVPAAEATPSATAVSTNVQDEEEQIYEEIVDPETDVVPPPFNEAAGVPAPQPVARPGRGPSSFSNRATPSWAGGGVS